MKHIHTFESFSNESVTEAEVLLFDEIGPELEAFRSKVEKLIDKSSDDKWITTLKKTMSSLDRLENDLSKADSKLGVVPVDEDFIDEKKSEDYIAYIPDKRSPGAFSWYYTKKSPAEADKEFEKMANKYSLQVMNRTKSGFEIMGALTDIEAFIKDEGIYLDNTERLISKR
jgi:hypothetical protein